MIEVQPANYKTLDDVAVDVPLLLQMHEESVFRCMRVNDLKLKNYLCHMSMRDDAVVLRAILEGKVVGIFVGQVYKHFFSDDLAATDQILYVAKSARGVGAAKLLIEAYRKWADKKDAKLVMVSIKTDIPDASQALRAMGYKEVGGNFDVRSN